MLNNGAALGPNIPDHPAIKQKWVSHDGSVVLLCGDALEIIGQLEYDHVIADPPYSSRTHDGHFATTSGHAGEGDDKSCRNELEYKAWSTHEVKRACIALRPSGWVCVFTDHTLGRAWFDTLEDVGRYVFAPVPFVVTGRSVRLSGDGPSSWTDWLIVSRTATEARWGTLRGAYLGTRENLQRIGGKPLGMMQAVVSDYSKAGDTVLDFCMGSGTTGAACVRLRRKFIGIDADPEAFNIAVKRLDYESRQTRMEFTSTPLPTQETLL